MEREPNSSTVAHLLQARAAAGGTRKFASFLDGKKYAVAELLERARAVAGGMASRGIGQGDRVALLIGNGVEFLDAWFGCHVLGAIAVPINVSLRGESLDHIFRTTEPSLIICETETIHNVRASYERVGLAVSRFAVNTDDTGWAEDFDRLRGAKIDPVALPATDPCCIMFTSGTTGASKGVVWTGCMTLKTIEVVANSMQYCRDETIYVCLPLYHGNALNTAFLPALLAGSRVAIARRFSASAFWDDIASSDATATNLLGAMSQILLSRDPSGVERRHKLKKILAIPAPPEYYTEFRERYDAQVVDAYGQVDVGMVLWNDLDDPKPGSCGRPVDGYELRIADENDHEVPDGSVGQLLVRWIEPNTSLQGYWQMPEATATAFRNLWFHTGDLMYRDSAGWYFFVDRAGDAIRRRGENISSREVEKVALSHRDVVAVAAYAVPSEMSEDEVVLAVVRSPNSRLSPDELLRAMENQLPYFALPRYVRFVDDLPMTSTEKVQKSVLRAEGLKPPIWDREQSNYEVRR